MEVDESELSSPEVSDENVISKDNMSMESIKKDYLEIKNKYFLFLSNSQAIETISELLNLNQFLKDKKKILLSQSHELSAKLIQEIINIPKVKNLSNETQEKNFQIILEETQKLFSLPAVGLSASESLDLEDHFNRTNLNDTVYKIKLICQTLGFIDLIKNILDIQEIAKSREKHRAKLTFFQQKNRSRDLIGMISKAKDYLNYSRLRKDKLRNLTLENLISLFYKYADNLFIIRNTMNHFCLANERNPKEFREFIYAIMPDLTGNELKTVFKACPNAFHDEKNALMLQERRWQLYKARISSLNFSLRFFAYQYLTKEILDYSGINATKILFLDKLIAPLFLKINLLYGQKAQNLYEKISKSKFAEIIKKNIIKVGVNNKKLPIFNLIFLDDITNDSSTKEKGLMDKIPYGFRWSMNFVINRFFLSLWYQEKISEDGKIKKWSWKDFSQFSPEEKILFEKNVIFALKNAKKNYKYIKNTKEMLCQWDGAREYYNSILESINDAYNRKYSKIMKNKRNKNAEFLFRNREFDFLNSSKSSFFKQNPDSIETRKYTKTPKLFGNEFFCPLPAK